MTNQPTQSQSKKQVKRFLIILLVAALFVALIITPKYFNVQEFLRSTLFRIESFGFWGVVAFIVIYILATILFIPGSILTLGGGAIFGVILGSIYVFIAATLGATAAFLVGRYLTRSWVSKQIEGNDKFKAIDDAVAREGFKIVLLTRLSPVFPFIFLNYAFGVTQVSLKDYFFGSVGMIPGTVMYVYLGSLAGNLAMTGAANQTTNFQAEATKWVVRIFGFIATVAVTIYITRVAKKALQDRV